MKILAPLFSVVSLFAASALADSPLTSTNFSDEYTYWPPVAEARNSGGVLTENLASILANQHNMLEMKAAIIDSLGWKIEGQNNAELFTEYLRKIERPVDNPSALRGDELFVLGYLRAMDNYLAVPTLAVTEIESAKAKIPYSLTVALVKGLIDTQTIMETSFCEVYTTMKDIRADKSYRRDMRPNAVDKIFAYINGYAEYCPAPVQQEQENVEQQNSQQNQNQQQEQTQQQQAE